MTDKEQLAIKRLQRASEMSLKEMGTPLVITTSGGKDSGVCVELARRAGIPMEVHHNHTTADAPETVRFVRKEIARLEDMGIKCKINYPTYKGKPTSMWTLIPQKLMPPTRKIRYCCDVLKEQGNRDRFIVTGVRWDESTRRKNGRGIYEKANARPEKRIILTDDNDDTRTLFEGCRGKGRRVCNPIVDWSNAEVWDYINSEKIPMNPLYEWGFDRVGCIGCPLAGRKRYREFATWPKYEQNYIRAFDRMLEERKKQGKMDDQWRSGTTGEEVMHWWMEDGFINGQLSFEDYLQQPVT